MQIVKYQLTESATRQVLQLPREYEPLCVKLAMVDGVMCPCLYVLHWLPLSEDVEEVKVLLLRGGQDVQTESHVYVGEYAAAVGEGQVFVFLTY